MLKLFSYLFLIPTILSFFYWVNSLETEFFNIYFFVFLTNFIITVFICTLIDTKTEVKKLKEEIEKLKNNK